jgi:4-aminobutyrate aminotransferase/(S)-3-amino-2-methylpropionate transaminase
MARREAAVPRGVSQVTPVFVARAEGAVIEDVDGNRFLDFAGGIGCLNAGHCAPAVVEATREQISRHLHACFMVTPYEGYVRLAERLNALAPGSFPKKTLFLNSGAEAVENAIKIARAYTKRPAVICFEDGFHGRTLLALALTSKTNPYKSGFEPFPGEVYRIPYAYCYRCSYGLRYPYCELHCAQHLEDTFKRVVAAGSVAAIIAEPVLGEGGFVTPPPGFLPAVQQICRKYGIVFIADEVQTGFARTGKLFASQHFDIEPDLITTAKSLGGGFPLAAVTGRAEIMDHTGPGALGGTFGGNPVACAAALAVLETIERENLCERAVCLGERFRKRAANFPMVDDIRGIGAMQAVELVSAEVTKRLSQYCYEHGLITISAGTYGNVVRLLMPLVITDSQFEEGLDVLEAGFWEVAA